MHRVQFAGRAVVDQIEQAGEGIAQIETAPAAVANIKDPTQFRIDLAVIEEIRLCPGNGVAGRCLQAAFLTHNQYLIDCLVWNNSNIFLGPKRRGSLCGTPSLVTF